MNDVDAAAREALRLLGADPPNWVPDRPGIDHNVAIIGGGQTGAAQAHALRRAGVGKVTVLDQAADADQTGIWLNAARMNLLRTPNSLVGPELSVTALGFQAWYEARHGAAAYAALDRIPRLAWAEYVAWFKDFLGIAPRYQTRVDRIEPHGDHFRLHMSTASGPVVETCRKIVLATGFSGAGGKFAPEVLTKNLPAGLYAHTDDAIDFAPLRGRTVAVVGAAASAFDAAGVALEHGAAAVHLFARRPQIAAVPVNRARGFPGAYDNFHLLPDADRWLHAVRYRRSGSTPTTDAIQRTVKHAHFHLHLSSPWTEAAQDQGRVVTTIKGQVFRFDFVIAGTGYSGALAARPELRDVADQILLWRDRYTPPADLGDDSLGEHPYLGAGHELMEKQPGTSKLLRDIHVQNPSGFVSFGVPVGDVPSMKRDIPMITAHISADLFQADLDTLRTRMTRDVAPDFTDALYRGSVR